MANSAHDNVVRSFLHFAEMCVGESHAPLYAHFASRIAETAELLALAASFTKGQPPVNLLFGAVHYLLLRSAGHGVQHRLTSHYASIDGTCSDHVSDDAWPEFKEFCQAHQEEIGELIRTRRVQTNEVGRCAALMPAIALAHMQMRQPLHLIEVGASAGLNLLMDRFRYRYGHSRTIGPDSPVLVHAALRSSNHFPLPDELPPVAHRVGIDIAPVDVRDDDAMRWLEALIWPDHVQRITLFRNARALAREDPPTIMRGDALDLLKDIIDTVAPDHLPCVYHSHTTYQMSTAWRARFDELIHRIGSTRDLAHVSLEWLGDNAKPQLHLSMCSNGTLQTLHIADCDHHGRWIEPIAQPGSAPS